MKVTVIEKYLLLKFLVKTVIGTYRFAVIASINDKNISFIQLPKIVIIICFILNLCLNWSSLVNWFNELVTTYELWLTLIQLTSSIVIFAWWFLPVFIKTCNINYLVHYQIDPNIEIASIYLCNLSDDTINST